MPRRVEVLPDESGCTRIFCFRKTRKSGKNLSTFKSLFSYNFLKIIQISTEVTALNSVEYIIEKPRTCLIWFRIFASGVFSLMRCHLIPSLNFTETLTASTRWMRSNEISSTDWLAPSTDQNKKKFCISFSISSKYQKRRRRFLGTDLPRLCIYCNIVPTRIYHVVASCFSSGYITCTRHLSDLIITNESTTSSNYFLANTNFLDS